ncbi:helix-turn-helix domain-containing protein [Actinokineospora sp.]|uniref:helix-turn-helix domain-containing protein n=1 Tax=Actinokineospora sp. TaxID=1872133 RepID=UPI004037EE4E
MTGWKRELDPSVPLGPALRQRRDDLGLNQKVVAKRAGVSRSTVQNLERVGQSGKQVESRFETINSVARALELDPREVLARTDHKPDKYEPSQAGRPIATVAEITSLANQLTEPERRTLIDIIRTFKGWLPTSSPATVERYRHGASLSEPESPRDPDRTAE